MTDFRKVRRGEPLRIPAATWNALLDAGRGFRQRQYDHRTRPAGPWPGEIVRVRNDSGSDIDQFGVLSVGEPAVGYGSGGWNNASYGPVFDPVVNANELVLKAIAPPVDGLPFVITQEPIAAGAVGRAMLTGVTLVLVDVSDASHYAAQAVTGVTGKLQSCPRGPNRLLWRHGIGVDIWCLIALSPHAGLHLPAAGGEEDLYLVWNAATGEMEWREIP